MNHLGIVVSDEGLGGVVPFGKALRESGLVPLLITGEMPGARLDAWRKIYDRVEVLKDPYDVQALEQKVVELTAGSQPAALFSCYDGLILPTAHVAAKFGTAHPAIAGLERSRNKAAMRLATSRQGLRTPRFSLIGSARECEAAAAEVGFPAVVKPLNGMASHLVRRVNGAGELRQTYCELTDRIRQSFAGNYSRPLKTSDGEGDLQLLDPRTTFLAEQFVAGAEYSAELLVRDGKVQRVALFHKFIVDQNGFLERGFTRPALGQGPEREALIWQHIEEAIAVLGVDQTAAHVEVIDTAEGPYLVEVNAGRAGGQILVRAVREATGIDLIAEIVALQSGRDRPAQAEPTLTGRVTTLTIFPPASGRIDQLEGLDEVARLPGVVDVIPFCGPGDVLDVEDKEVFAVNLLVSGVEGDEIFSLYDQASRLVRFTISPAPAYVA
jgi:hypothetical protein